ncbi:hypothetical protein [Pragia fontium]|uniref:hypothetical protein n=1 Tax=Pragia fontium TaxID=82985 RepID=UPI00130D781B|nr:hypothetical protein [Pragia fontium]
MSNDDKYASIMALLNMIINCSDDTDIETMQRTAFVAWVMLKDFKSPSSSHF